MSSTFPQQIFTRLSLLPTLYSAGVCYGVFFSLVLSHYTLPILRMHMSVEICQENDTKYLFFPQVSIFLKDKVQNSNGRFVLPVSGPVPWGTEVPGLIR